MGYPCLVAQYDVFGMCNPLYDILAEVPETLLDELGFAKGGMFLIDQDQQRQLVDRTYEYIVKAEAGGSGANTMIGLGMLGGKGVYTGHVGTDEHAELYRQSLNDQGIKPNLGVSDGTTGICLVLVTPDTQRTMCTFLGLSRELDRNDVNVDDLRASKYLYATAYLWDTDNQKDAVLHAMKEANQAGVKVALSLSDPFCVNRHKDDLLTLVRDHVDLLFGNFQEAQALTDTDSPEDALRKLSEWSEIAVVTLDDKGSLIQRGEERVQVPVHRVTAVDTTGAGDMYAAGLLYGVTQGLSLEKTGRIASYAAAMVVSKLGPRLESIDASVVSSL